MKSIRFVTLLLIVLFCATPSHSFAMGSNPSVKPFKEDIPEGTYDLVLYGYDYSGDPLTVAVLDLQGDSFTFQPMSHKSKYEIKKSVESQTALSEARRYVSQHSDSNGVRINKITDQKGRIIGYEVRPVYHITRYGFADILDVHYWFRDSTVFFSVDYQWRLKRRHRLSDEYY